LHSLSGAAGADGSILVDNDNIILSRELTMSTYHHGDLRSAVLTAAAKMIEKEGLSGLSVRAAARRAGVSHNAPYRHFPNRDALLAALAADGFKQLAIALEGRTGKELGEAYVRFALDHPQRFRLMFGSRLSRPELLATFEGAFAGMGSEARFAAAAGWSLVHGLAQLVLDGHFEDNADFVAKVLGSVRFAVGAQRSA
jgi:AcrR family transcriptional regulator